MINEIPQNWRQWARQLKNKKVTIVDWRKLWLACDECHESWSPNIPPAGKRLARGYWICPNGCNSELSQKWRSE